MIALATFVGGGLGSAIVNWLKNDATLKAVQAAKLQSELTATLTAKTAQNLSDKIDHNTAVTAIGATAKNPTEAAKAIEMIAPAAADKAADVIEASKNG